MNDEILMIEQKVKKLGTELSSSIETNEKIKTITKDYYKHLMIALKIIQRQKEELLELEIKLHDANEEILVKDIMRFCDN